MIVLNNKSICMALFFIGVFLSFFLNDSALAKGKSKTKSRENNKYAAMIVDANTGAVLHQENAGKLLHPASLTKMMTLLLLFDALDSGRAHLSDRIQISQHAASMAPSKLGLKPGSTIKVEDAILALVTKSANDIAVAVAEHLGKTESNFARVMTQRARQLGMNQTVFRNASGLHNPAQVTTARDMARLGVVLVSDYRRHYHYFSTKSFAYRGAKYRNHNRLMETYKGMDGLKTGYIGPSGFNLVASAKRDGRRLVGVVFGGKTSVSRNDRMRVLLDEGFKGLKGKQEDKLLVAKDTGVPVPLRKPADALMAKSLKMDTSSDEMRQAMDNRLAQEQFLYAEGKEDMATDSRAAGGVGRWAMVGDNSPFLAQLSGEGDFDQDVRGRLTAGLIAAAAYSAQEIPQAVWEGRYDSPELVSLRITEPSGESKGANWAIQIGAFTNRDRTDVAIAESLKKLPISLRSASAVIAPVQTPQGWIFRARLNGYTKAAAEQACSILSECIPIAPTYVP